METAYYTEYAQVQHAHWWYLARAEILQAILHEFLQSNRAAGHLLDLGCGPGEMRSMLAQFGKLVSTDFTFEALQFCTGQQLDYLVAADGVKLPFREGQFEAACAFDVIEHLRDDALAVRELHRILKPRGILVVTVPAFQFLWGRQDIVSHHVRRYSAPMLRTLFTAAQFDVLKLSYFNTFLFPPIAAVRLGYRLLGLNRRKTAGELQSDFTMPHRSWLNELLRRAFAAEKNLLLRRNLPFGVSLLCVGRKTQ